MSTLNSLRFWITTHRQLLLIVIGCMFAFGVSAGASFTWFATHSSATKNTVQVITPQPTPSPTPDPLAPVSIALLGYGGQGHQGGSLTDSIIVAKIKPREKQVLLFSVPRDLWVTLPLQPPLQTKINMAYALGFDTHRWPIAQRPPEYAQAQASSGLAKSALSQILGFPVQHHAAVSFTGFTQTLAKLGPITVQVPSSFTDEFYPIAGKETDPCDKSEADIQALTATLSGFLLEKQFTCRYEKLEFTAGKQELDPETALKFVRSRHSEVNGNDFGRSLRQQAVIQGAIQKISNPTVWPKLPQTITSAIRSVDTDLDTTVLFDWLKNFPNPKEYTLHSYGLSTDNALVASRSADRQFILVPKPEIGWEGVQRILSDWEQSVATYSSSIPKSTQSAVQSGHDNR